MLRGPKLQAPTRDTGPEIARVDNLCVTFRRDRETVYAVRGVSLDLQPGEIVGVVGESGSGKSVLGLSLLGLLPDRPRPEISGSVRVIGVDMVHDAAESRRLVRRRHMGAIFQDPMTSLNPTMKVGRQIQEAAGSPAEAQRLMEAVGIPDARRRMDVLPHELSGGLRQRVMIAMAIAGEPALVIADEPTTALDVTVQAQILELVHSLRQQMNTTFLIITHDLGVAAEVADRIAVMYAGRLAEIGPAADMYHRPRHPYSRGLLRSRLDLSSDRSRPVTTLRGEPPDPRQLSPGCPFGPRCNHHREECDTAVPMLTARPGAGPGAVACCRAGLVDDESSFDAPPPPWPVPAPAPGGPKPPTAAIIKDLRKSFDIGARRTHQKLHALRGVDLELAEGEAVALVGESGCGKSTLLRCVAGLQPIDGGFVDLARGGRPQMVFQDAGASLTPWMNVGDLIAERLREEHLDRRSRARRVAEALKLVGLAPEVASARPRQLSGGQRQRVALARATVVPPELLLCDEPTSALDVSLAGVILNLIGRLRRELAMAVLFVTHDLAAARIVADRIAVMYLGRIVEIGSAEDVCVHPVHPYTAALLTAVPGTGAKRVRLAGEPASPLDPPSGCEFHPRCPDARRECATTPPELASTTQAGRLVACPVMIGRTR